LSTYPNCRHTNAPVPSGITTEPGTEGSQSFVRSQHNLHCLRTDRFVTCSHILGFVWRYLALTAHLSKCSDCTCADPVSNSHRYRLYQLQPCGRLFWGSKRHKCQWRCTGSSDQLKFDNYVFCPDYSKHRYEVQLVSQYAVICFVSLLLNQSAFLNDQHCKIYGQAGQISKKTS